MKGAVRFIIERLISKIGLWKSSSKDHRGRDHRYPLELSIQYRLYLPSRVDVFSHFITARTYDLYEHGMGMLADAVGAEGFHILHSWPETMEQCLMEIEIPCRGEVITLKGKAVWYHQQPNEAHLTFRVGVHFLDLTAERRAEIREIIHRNSCIDDTAPQDQKIPGNVIR